MIPKNFQDLFSLIKEEDTSQAFSHQSIIPLAVTTYTTELW